MVWKWLRRKRKRRSGPVDMARRFNEGVMLLPYVAPEDNDGATALPCLVVAGVQVYGYVAQDRFGRLYLAVSIDYDTTDTALVGTDGTVPTVITGGNRVLLASDPELALFGQHAG